jgi:plastocyanin
VRAAILAAVVLLLPGCRADAPADLQPDSILRSALGLTDRDVVHRVQVRSRGTREIAEPSRVTAEPGTWVSFQGGDARGHVVRFDTTAISATGVDWLRVTDQIESPPLLTPASRWVVSFLDAPEGFYPFVVEGGGETGSGGIEIRKGGD